MKWLKPLRLLSTCVLWASGPAAVCPRRGGEGGTDDGRVRGSGSGRSTAPHASWALPAAEVLGVGWGRRGRGPPSSASLLTLFAAQAQGTAASYMCWCCSRQPQPLEVVS